MVTGAAGKHTKIEKTTASRESGFQLSRYLLWNVYAKKLAALGYTNIIEIGGINDWTGETVSGDS